MYKKILLLCALTFLISPLTYSKNDTYLCVTEDVSGFYFENNKWGHAYFNDRDKYILRKLKKDESGYTDKNNTYGLFELGENSTLYKCIQNPYSNNFKCTSFLGEFFYSPKTGRFLKTYTQGYWGGGDNNENTPNMAIGKCSKI